MTARIGFTRGGVNSGSNTTLSISRDTGTLTGDLVVVVVDIKSGANGPQVSPPDGTWTRVPGTNTGGTPNTTFPTGGTGGNQQVFYKTATTDGAQTYTFTIGSSGAVSTWLCVTLRNASAPVVRGSSTATSSPVTTSGITTGEANEYLLRFLVAAFSTSTVTTTTWDAATTKLTDVQGSGATTGLGFGSVSEEIGPSSAGAVAGRTVSLSGATISGIGTVTLAFPTAGSGSAPVNTVAPAITTDGTPETGETVTSDTGTWSNTPTSYAYQWKRNGSNISGATSSSYLLQSADEGQTVTVTVTATNAFGSASATSASITPSAVTPGSAPVNTVLPVISTDGTPEVGETVTCSTGTWSNSPTAYAYQWLRNGVAISGATSSSYVITSGDVGTNKLSCSVTATNASGSTTANAASISPTASPTAWRNITVYRYSNGVWT